MSINKLQVQHMLEYVTHAYFATGVKPTVEQVFKSTSEYFSKYPVGSPIPMPQDAIDATGISNVDEYNRAMAALILNINTLYEAMFEQVDDILMLNTAMRTYLDRLQAYRQRLETRVDDYLLSMNNTDGYFYSFSDSFTDTSGVDLALTSAHIDTTTGSVILPTVGYLTRRATKDEVGLSGMSVTIDGVAGSFESLAPFDFALDDLTNTAWYIKVRAQKPVEVIAQVDISVLGSNSVTGVIDISRLEFTPYGITPVQVFAATVDTTPGSDIVEFGGKIETSANKIVFVDGVRKAATVKLVLRKTTPDYTDDSSGRTEYVYVFGAKEIAILRQVYDNTASVVSETIFLPDALSDSVIDAVSLTVAEEIVEGTDIKYYVAADPGVDSPELSDFNWTSIQPATSSSTSSGIVHFDGALPIVKNVLPTPSTNDLQLIALDSTANDLAKRNPSPTIIAGIDTYRITAFTDSALAGSITLEEGVNTTRIYSTTLNADGLNLAYWVDKFDRATYGRIDTGNGFFYGGDVGESNKSVYVDTLLTVENAQSVFLSRFVKSDANSRQWSIKIFLNGREVAYLPVGADSVAIPWAFQEGLNHIVMLATIPDSTSAVPNPYLGTVELLDADSLTNYGTVRLASWHEVDFFAMQYNETDQSYAFTIYNGEIISRRKPTTNFRLRYSKATGGAPLALRVRADLSRNVENQYVSPRLDSYRLRFSYHK